MYRCRKGKEQIMQLHKNCRATNQSVFSKMQLIHSVIVIIMSYFHKSPTTVMVSEIKSNSKEQRSQEIRVMCLMPPRKLQGKKLYLFGQLELLTRRTDSEERQKEKEAFRSSFGHINERRLWVLGRCPTDSQCDAYNGDSTSTVHVEL